MDLETKAVVKPVIANTQSISTISFLLTFHFFNKEENMYGNGFRMSRFAVAILNKKRWLLQYIFAIFTLFNCLLNKDNEPFYICTKWLMS